MSICWIYIRLCLYIHWVSDRLLQMLKSDCCKIFVTGCVPDAGRGNHWLDFILSSSTEWWLRKDVCYVNSQNPSSSCNNCNISVYLARGNIYVWYVTSVSYRARSPNLWFIFFEFCTDFSTDSMESRWCGDSAGNTVEENPSIFSLIRMQFES